MSKDVSEGLGCCLIAAAVVILVVGISAADYLNALAKNVKSQPVKQEKITVE